MTHHSSQHDDGLRDNGGPKRGVRQILKAPPDRWSTLLEDHHFTTSGFSECILPPQIRFNGIEVSDTFNGIDSKYGHQSTRPDTTSTPLGCHPPSRRQSGFLPTYHCGNSLRPHHLCSPIVVIDCNTRHKQRFVIAGTMETVVLSTGM